MAIKNVPKFETLKDPLAEKREQDALRKFKYVLQDLVVLLRQSTKSDTVLLYWVNKEREQFVLESKSTIWSNTIFQDRIAFDNIYLKDYKDITEPIQLEVGRHVTEEELIHYYKSVPIKFITLLPFINNGETVALTMMESKTGTMNEEEEEATIGYMNALGNLLHTFLELSDLSDNQNQWIQYEETLDNITDRLSNVQVLRKTIENMQEYLPNGGVSVVSRSMDSWNAIWNSSLAVNNPSLGLSLEENTIAYDALQTGKPVFTIHFNGNPKRISAKETLSNGASLAIPMLLKDRRHAVIVVYDENPLVFKESNKHKLINLVRLAALRIDAGFDSPGTEGELMANEYGAYKMEYWEEAVKIEIERIKSAKKGLFTWFGMVTLADLSAIRTRFRLEELMQLQRRLVKQLNPANYGISGFIGHYSDYIYSFMIQSENKNAVSEWVSGLKNYFDKPYVSESGQEAKLQVQVGYTTLDEKVKDVQQAIREAKEAVSRVVKNPDSATCEYH